MSQFPSPAQNQPLHRRCQYVVRRCRYVLRIISCLLCLAVPPIAAAQEDKPRLPDEPMGIEDGSWARFGVGSWKLVRISKEVFAPDGKLESMTTQEGKTTLVAVDGDRFTLQEEVTLEVAGKRFKSATRTIQRGLNNETEGQTVTSKLLHKENVVICQREYPSQIHEITISDDKSKCVSKLFYSPDVEPFVLKRETTCTNQTGKTTNQASVEVLALDMPHRVLTELKPSAHIKTVHVQFHDQGNVTTVTLEVSCTQVPGHIVSHSAKIVGPEGRLRERSTLELLDYEVASK